MNTWQTSTCVQIVLLNVEVLLICLGTQVSRYVGTDVTQPFADFDESRKLRKDVLLSYIDQEEILTWLHDPRIQPRR
jgi:hypothetical protein